MTLDELLALLPRPFSDYVRFDPQYLGLGEWTMVCAYSRNLAPTGTITHVETFYRLMPTDDRDQTPQRRVIRDCKLLNEHLALTKKVTA